MALPSPLPHPLRYGQPHLRSSWMDDPLKALSFYDDEFGPATSASEDADRRYHLDREEIIARTSIFLELPFNELHYSELQYMSMPRISRRHFLILRLEESRHPDFDFRSHLPGVSAPTLDIVEADRDTQSTAVVAPLPQTKPSNLLSYCLSCSEMKTRTVKVDCGHNYCQECIKTMFDVNIDDEYRFPPRCCRQFISADHLQDLFPKDMTDLYQLKIKEYSTIHRLYCCNKTCLRFLGARQGQAASVLCSDCNTSTCSRCIAQAHPSNVRCKVDRDLRLALKLGQSHGWQRCPRCQQLIEKNMGCMHIMCRCGAQFCYRCSGQWGKCDCSSGHFLSRLYSVVKIRKTRNYLLRKELAGTGMGGMLSRLCKQSWNGVVGVVTSKKQG